MTLTKSVETTILDVPPSCIEVCPWDPNLFAVGTYLLHKNLEDTQNTGTEESSDQRQNRTGTLELYRIGAAQNSVGRIYSQSCDYAILDLHFPPLHHADRSSIWTANSSGSLTRHQVLITDDDHSTWSRAGNTSSTVFKLRDPSILALSFVFHPTDPTVLGVTFSDGSVILCKMSSPSERASPSTVEVAAPEIFKHDLEAWTMSFDLHGLRLFSGGDDALLECSIAEVKGRLDPTSEYEVQSSLVWKNRKVHGAGVVAILPLDEKLVLTGSYDDHMRLVNVEKIPRVLTEQNLDGGVWRLKLMDSHKDKKAVCYDILASCMHAGVRIVRITVAEHGVPRIDILARFEEHESMNYGSDFVVSRDDVHEYTILSTSFYDSRLCLWKCRTPAFSMSGA